MTNVDEWKTVELDGRTYGVRRYSIGDATVVYEAHVAGEQAVGSDAERATGIAYPAVMRMHGAVKRDGRIETQEHAPEAIDYPAALT